MKSIATTVIFSLFLILSFAVFAAGIGETTGGAVSLPNPLGETSTIYDLIKKIVDWLILVASPIAVGVVIFGAFQLMFSGGDVEKVKTARRTILYTVVGYAIILVGWGITSIIESVLTTTPSS